MKNDISKAISQLEDTRVNYPFPAIVNQELLKRALLLLAVNPKIGGLLIRGEKGSGKSTAVRALGDLLPEIEVVADCPFHCDPHDISNMCEVCRRRYENGETLPIKKTKMKIVTLPLGATEDRVLGTIDVEAVLKEGVKAFQPGILAEANRNVLYIDEINLLPDHLVDDILDAAASGWNIVEREGVSIKHPARFILIGTMNPEEGDLRPQLLDRLALSVTIFGTYKEDERIEIIKRNLEFIDNPAKFREKYNEEIQKLREQIENAKTILPRVRIDDYFLLVIAKLTTRLKVDGHRPDIVIALTAKTNAALEGREEVNLSDIEIAAILALGHRTRSGGYEEPATPTEIRTTLAEVAKEVEKFFRSERNREK